jgi:endonuclease/exonuclease/phosphatase family metal-dependent hydrolase
MSFNIRVGSANDGPDSWEHPTNGVDRRDLVVQTINNFGPDLLGLQEALRYQWIFLRDEIPGYTVVGRSVNDDGTREYANVFYKTSRFTELDRGNFWLHPDNTPGVAAWDAALPRIATWVKLRDNQTPGLSFVYLNTHWDHVGTTARQESALLIRDQLEDIAGPLPVILSGDFNAAIDSVAYNRMMGRTNLDRHRDYLDSFAEAHPNDTTNNGTAHGFNGGTGGNRIDWILHDDGFDTRSASIVRTSYDGRYPSDHFPITAVLRAVPEPASLSLLLPALLPLARRRRRRP